MPITRLLYAAIAGLLLLASCAPNVEQLLAEGGIAMKQEDWSEAEKKFERVVEHNPSLAEAYRALANCRLKQGKNEAAAEALREFVRLRPDDCRAHLLLAQYAVEQEQWDEAVSHIVRARQFAEYRDEIQECQRWLDGIRESVKSISPDVPVEILGATKETEISPHEQDSPNIP